MKKCFSFSIGLLILSAFAVPQDVLFANDEQLISGQETQVNLLGLFSSKQYYINKDSAASASLKIVSQNSNWATSVYVQADSPASKESYFASYQTCNTADCSANTVEPINVDLLLNNVATRLYIEIGCWKHLPSCCSSYPPCNSTLTVTLTGHQQGVSSLPDWVGWTAGVGIGVVTTTAVVLLLHYCKKKQSAESSRLLPSDPLNS